MHTISQWDSQLISNKIPKFHTPHWFQKLNILLWDSPDSKYAIYDTDNDGWYHNGNVTVPISLASVVFQAEAIMMLSSTHYSNKQFIKIS